jgi:hypothetical protein
MMSHKISGVASIFSAIAMYSLLSGSSDIEPDVSTQLQNETVGRRLGRPYESGEGNEGANAHELVRHGKCLWRW